MASPDRLFRRYRRTRDPELLARVFDATAPRLLRLAIHLARDVAEAEDLVQATFVAAIERAERFEANGEVLPWLQGILSNKARHARRQAARRVDPERLVERAAATPFEEAAAAELSGELARAVDSLDEPYRRVLVLRLRHGMNAIDIAHVLDLSPGAVRVRLSRGMQKLRHALPVGLASALALVATPERGLAAVREAVVAEAKAAALVAGTSTITLGGLLMTKKLVLGSLGLVVALAATALYRGIRPARGDGVAAVARGEAELASPDEATLEESPPPAAELPGQRKELEEAAAPELVALRGLVIDGRTGEPLAGARVELHEPERMLYSELKERSHPYVRQLNWRGELRSFASWPWFEAQGELGMASVAQRHDAIEISVFDRPREGSVPARITHSDAQGRFELFTAPAGGTVVCELAGYGRRSVPVAAPEAEVRISMRRPGRLTGVVIDTEGHRIEQQIELLFWGGMQEVAFDENDRWIEHTREAWLATSEPDGSFDVELPAEYVHPHIRTPGLLTRQAGHHPIHDGPWIFDQQFEPGGPNACACGEVHPVYVVAQRVPVLRVTDAETGADIEHFSMIGRELKNGYARWAGRYFAPGGTYPIVNDEIWIGELRNTPFSLIVWADGYRETTLELTDLPSEEVIEAALRPGRTPGIAGTVLEEGEPVEGAQVSLEPHDALQWRAEPDRGTELMRTGPDGRFELHGPAGKHVLFVVAGENVYAEPVTLPDDHVRVIDLAAMGRVTVEVRDSDGVLQVGHAVVLRDDTGRSDWRETDEEGRVLFGCLPDGSYEVRVPRVATRGSFSGGIADEVEVRGGGARLVPITVPAIGAPRHAQLVVDVEQDFGGWTARGGGMEEWVDVQADGTIPIDLQLLSWRRLTIADPGGRRWGVDVPDPLPEDFEISLVLDGPRLEGVLLDMETGRPIRNARVGGHAMGPGAQPSSVTDEQGLFTLPCEQETVHRLTFNSDTKRPLWYDHTNARRGFAFVTATAASRHPAPMTIRLPLVQVSDGVLRGLATKRLHGHVIREGSGEPQPGSRVWVFGLQAQLHGTLEIYGDLTVVTGPDGRYELVVPDVPRYRVSVHEPGVPQAALTEEWDGLAGADEECDFVLP